MQIMKKENCFIYVKKKLSLSFVQAVNRWNDCSGVVIIILGDRAMNFVI